MYETRSTKDMQAAGRLTRPLQCSFLLKGDSTSSLDLSLSLHVQTKMVKFSEVLETVRLLAVREVTDGVQFGGGGATAIPEEI